MFLNYLVIVAPLLEREGKNFCKMFTFLLAFWVFLMEIFFFK